jgi:Putative peptidoglycan binding domain/L,D-transpeptidase catalytic domain
MRYSVRRVLFCAGAAAAVGVSACAQIGTASAAQVATAAHQVKTAAATYVPPTHNFSFGAHGAAVKSVQRRLNQLHYYAGPVDGKYGSDTAQAVWAFKEAQGLPLNGATHNLVTGKFRHDLIHPRMPKVLVPKGGSNRIEINQSDELLVLYRKNTVRLILHVSSGGNCLIDQGCGWITPDGNYKALSFVPGWVTVPLGEMYNPVFFIGEAYAIHGETIVPWYPDSHGCVRIWMDAAQWFHKDVTVGGKHATPVYIRGTAPYSSLAN